MKNNKPILAIRLGTHINAGMYVLHYKKRSIKGQQIIVNWKTSEKLNGKEYYEILIRDVVTEFDYRLVKNIVGVLLLPRISQINENAVTYCLISSDWRTT
jgi:hypothetical protein